MSYRDNTRDPESTENITREPVSTVEFAHWLVENTDNCPTEIGYASKKKCTRQSIDGDCHACWLAFLRSLDGADA